jgi:hypothetical protein
MFLQENMDKKDGVTTSSKEQMSSPVRVQVHDEITPKGGKDRSVTKEHPRGLKRKRLDFMREDPLSWTRGWRHLLGGSKIGWDPRTQDSGANTQKHERWGDKESPKACTHLKRCESLYTCPRAPFCRGTKELLHSEITLESREYS